MKGKKLRSASVALMILFLTAALAAGCAPLEEKGPRRITGTVAEIEKYGHATLDITKDALARAGYEPGDVVRLEFEGSSFEMPYFTGYYVRPGELMLRGRNKDSTVSVCINYGDFSRKNRVQPGDSVTITLQEKAGMLDVEQANSLVYLSNDRADYESDAAFANFRPVTVGGIGEGRLYRSASPINNIYNRAPYADKCIEAAGVKTVLNLSDAPLALQQLLAQKEPLSPYYRNLCAAEQVIALDLGSDLFSHSFARTMAEGFVFLSEREGPFLIHCQEGKDRTGFAVMVLEALMGADREAIQKDYMISYLNCYGITEASAPDTYRAVAENNLTPFLCHMAGVTDSSALDHTDLQQAAVRFLLDAGMSRTQIEALQAMLR